MDRPLYIAAPGRLPQPRGPAEWGTWMPLLHRSIADIHEKELVARVLSHPRDRETLLNIKGIESKDALILREVPLRKFGGRRDGDVDVLVVPPGAPEQATAIQVKRFPIKIDEKGFAHARANHLEELFDKGIEQANDTARLGFSQVYLWIFILIDARARNGGRFTYDGASPELHSRIENAVSQRRTLRAGVGLMDFDWVQPIDRAPFEFGSGGSHLRDLAKSNIQPAELTDRVRRLTEQPIGS